MYECVILFRNTMNDRVGFVTDAEGEMRVFANRDEALAEADHVPILQVYPWQLVELDEL
jgi:hypothetical protein